LRPGHIPEHVIGLLPAAAVHVQSSCTTFPVSWQPELRIVGMPCLRKLVIARSSTTGQPWEDMTGCGVGQKCCRQHLHSAHHVVCFATHLTCHTCDLQYVCLAASKLHVMRIPVLYRDAAAVISVHCTGFGLPEAVASPVVTGRKGNHLNTVLLMDFCLHCTSCMCAVRMWTLVT
jgi:hypothetical protein